MGIVKLFSLNPHAEAFPELEGALACALATFLMVLTQTLYPPAGATAFMAATPAVAELGWCLIPVVLLGSALMICTALVVNNVVRRYPLYWLKPCESSGHSSSDSAINLEKLSENGDYDMKQSGGSVSVIIQPGGRVFVPDNVFLTDGERELLEGISNRLGVQT